MPFACSQTIKSMSIVLFAVVASGQQPVDQGLDRTLSLAYTERPQDVQEIASVIRGVTGVPVLSTDPAQRTVVLRGTADQIAIAEWLLHELDEAGRRRPESYREYRAPGGGGELIRIIYLRHAESDLDLQDVATNILGVGDTGRWVFTYQSPKALIVRGTADQVALAAWLGNELDKPVMRSPSGQRSHTSASYEYRPRDRGGREVRVLYLANAEPIRELMETASLIRRMTDMPHTFASLGRRALVLRGSADQVELAEWLYTELDNPANWPPAAQGTRDLPGREYRVPGGNDEMVRIVYLSRTESFKQLEEVAKSISAATGIRRLCPYSYSLPRAMVMRGPVQQVASAEQLIKEQDKSALLKVAR